MKQPIENLLLTIAFFTRLPLPQSLGNRISHENTLSDAIIFFPVVGLIAAALPSAIWFLGSFALSPELAAGLALLTMLLVTGALHEDGLADCADGLGGTSDRRKALDIMRDSRIGTYGALALGIALLLKWAALSSLEPLTGVLALLITHSASRSTMVLAMRFSDYARPEGLGKLASEPVEDRDFAITVAITFLIAVVLGWFSGLTAVALGFIAAWLMLRYLDYRLGGYTGDGLGAMQQVSEIVIFIALAGFWA